MGYRMQDGSWADTEAVTLLGSSTQTASTNSTGIELGDRAMWRGTLDVTAASGTTPTLDVTLQTSADNSTWRTLGTFTQKTTTGSERKSFAGCDRYVRATSVIAGTTPSFTFSIAGEAV